MTEKGVETLSKPEAGIIVNYRGDTKFAQVWRNIIQSAVGPIALRHALSAKAPH